MSRNESSQIGISDIELQKRVLEELAFEPSVNAAHIGVSAEDGIITLTGHVGNYAEKQEAERAVRRVKGVTAIAEHIEVRYPGEKKTADDEIAKRAINILEWYDVLPRESIQITVQNGWLTLEGRVNWQHRKKAAEEALRRLSGLVGIVNNIVVVSPVDSSDVKKKIEEALRRRTETEAQAIRITIRDRNNVSLEGVVDSWDEREAAENAAWSIAGAQSVDNRLTIVR
jgi:osmotically-inducible protein OsmY